MALRVSGKGVALLRLMDAKRSEPTSVPTLPAEPSAEIAEPSRPTGSGTTSVQQSDKVELERNPLAQVAVGRKMVRLDTVDFAGILALAEPFLTTAGRLAEWEHDGWIGGAGSDLLLSMSEQWSALEAAIAAAGLADRETAWLADDARRLAVARCLRDLTCDIRRGHLGHQWRPTISDDGETLKLTEERTADLTFPVVVKRLGATVNMLREIVPLPPALDPRREETPPEPTASLEAVATAAADLARQIHEWFPITASPWLSEIHDAHVVNNVVNAAVWLERALRAVPRPLCEVWQRIHLTAHYP